jgi:hypothetical protein
MFKLSNFTVILTTSLAATLPIIGCSVEKKFNEMQQSTAQMEQTTAHMDATTTDLKKEMDQTNTNLDGMKKTEFYLAQDNDALKASMAQVFDQGRQGQSMDDRRKLLIETLKTVDSMGAKVATAVQYFMTFEYQLWTDGEVTGDTAIRKQALIDDAVNEFFTVINEFWEDAPAVNPLGRTGLLEVLAHAASATNAALEDKKAQNFNALAAALEYLNRKQTETLAAHPDLKPITMLSLVENALADQPYVDYGKKSLKTISLAEQKIQSNRVVAIKLLQARENILPLLALAKISPLGLEGSVAGLAKVELETWPLNINNMGAASLAEASYFLSEAQAARAFLVSLKDPRAIPQDDSLIARAWNNAQVQFDNKVAVQSNGSEVAEEKTQFYGIVGLEKQFHGK